MEVRSWRATHHHAKRDIALGGMGMIVMFVNIRSLSVDIFSKMVYPYRL